jgi:hypothetical protein
MEQVKVIGKIDLIEDSKPKCKCTCDDCHAVLNDSFGDPRVKISTYSSKYSTKPDSVRLVCEQCADEQFGDNQPYSIFG